MNREKPGYVDVEALMARVTLEQTLAFYAVTNAEIQRVGNEIRTRCFLACGKKGETGNRALAIQADHPAKIWRCFEAGCGRSGNLVSLCDFLKPGDHGNGRPRGDRFKAILHDLQAMAAGEEGMTPTVDQRTDAPAAPSAPATRHRGNVPLAQSGNERARALVDLDRKFIVEAAQMSPQAASYVRHRRFLTREACVRWRVGYLPRDAGGDHVGGTMRGKFVYPMLSDDGEVLTWFGRDPDYEAKAHEWVAAGKQGKEPEKYHFVKGFERGGELFGQHRLQEEGMREKLEGVGVLVVPGPNDVIALDAIGVPAAGLCAHGITREQVEKIGQMAGDVGGGRATVLLDCTEVGVLAARVVLVALAEVCAVRLAWSDAMHDGRFKGRTVASLTAEEWETLRREL